MKTLLLVTAFVLVSSTGHAGDPSGILAALQNVDGALADVLRPKAEGSLTSLEQKVIRLGDEIRETRSKEYNHSTGPQIANADRTMARAK